MTPPVSIIEDQIRLLVDRFYETVRADAELGSIAERALDGCRGPHLAKLYDLWSSVMLTGGRDKGNPLAAHLLLCSPGLGD